MNRRGAQALPVLHAHRVRQIAVVRNIIRSQKRAVVIRPSFLLPEMRRSGAAGRSVWA